MPHLAGSLETDVLSVLPGVPPWPKQTGRRLDSEKVLVDFINWPRLPIALSETQEEALFRPEIGASIILALDFQIQLLDQLYILRERAEVIRFIEERPFLAPLLLEAHGEIAKFFGPYPHVFLEIVTDPEAARARQLVAFVSTPLSPDEALDRLARLDEGWWLEALERAAGNLCITLEFE